MSTNSKRIAFAAAAAALVVGGAAGLAGASANNEKPSYDSHGESEAGLEIPGVLVVGESDSVSDTEKKDDGASSSASANSLQLLGTNLGGNAECTSQGNDNAGVDEDVQENAVIDQTVGPVAVRVLGASCESMAVQSNTADSSAESSVLTAEVEGTEVVVLGSESTNTTTSGQARSESSFTVLSVGETTVLGCGAESQTTHGSESDRETFTVLDSEQEGECPVASASTTFERITPNDEG